MNSSDTVEHEKKEKEINQNLDSTSEATHPKDSTEQITNETEGEINHDKEKQQNDLREKHPLTYGYCIWFNRRVQGARTQENYEKSIKRVGSFATVEDFWDYYSHLIRPNDLPNTSDYHLFKEGIRPMWEDDANKSGGKWILRLRKGLASKYWELLLLAVVGEQFDNVGDEICGAVVSIRYQEDIISLWNRSSTDQDTKLKILETLKRVLVLDHTARLEYKNHDASIRDNSSFRNTEQVPLYISRERERSERGERRERPERDGERDSRDRDRFEERPYRERRFDKDRDRDRGELGAPGAGRGERRERRDIVMDKPERRPFPKKIRPPIHQPK